VSAGLWNPGSGPSPQQAPRQGDVRACKKNKTQQLASDDECALQLWFLVAAARMLPSIELHEHMHLVVVFLPFLVDQPNQAKPCWLLVADDSRSCMLIPKLLVAFFCFLLVLQN
jgi:hypothetical protein